MYRPEKFLSANKYGVSFIYLFSFAEQEYTKVAMYFLEVVVW